MVEIHQIKEALEYDPETGKFTWKHREGAGNGWNSKFSGKEAGCINYQGYRALSVNGEFLYGHRAAWAIQYGEYPSLVDHINGDKSDNRIENLRSVDAVENRRNTSRNRNNISGTTGVSWNTKYSKWRATIMVARRCIDLGKYSDLSQAVAARKGAEIQYGFHENHGRSAS